MAGEQECVTRAEMQENRDFIDAVMETPVMQHVWEYLKKHGRDIPDDELKFKVLLYNTWFRLFRRTKGDK